MRGVSHFRVDDVLLCLAKHEAVRLVLDEIQLPAQDRQVQIKRPQHFRQGALSAAGHELLEVLKGLARLHSCPVLLLQAVWVLHRCSEEQSIIQRAVEMHMKLHQWSLASSPPPVQHQRRHQHGCPASQQQCNGELPPGQVQKRHGCASSSIHHEHDDAATSLLPPLS
eukprot:scaffold442_cov268-Pinguiococcus_pyrenoidosus.AAC.66